MKLFLIKQEENNDYEMYDSAVVVAPDEETARQTDPRTGEPMARWGERCSNWCSGPEHVVVEYLGEAIEGIEQGVVLASFNAG